MNGAEQRRVARQKKVREAQLAELMSLPPESEGDRFRTPPWLFAFLTDRYGRFDVDLCADHDNKRCEYAYTRTNSCLGAWADWRRCGTRGFMNPPYSGPYPFVRAAWEYAQKGFSTTLVLPTHTNQEWHGLTQHATERIELIGRVNFWKQDGSGPMKGNRGGTQIVHFEAGDLGFLRTVWLRTADLVARYSQPTQEQEMPR